jgi:hypothetical protein
VDLQRRLQTRGASRISRAKFNLSPQLAREIIEAEIDVSMALVN